MTDKERRRDYNQAGQNQRQFRLWYTDPNHVHPAYVAAHWFVAYCQAWWGSLKKTCPACGDPMTHDEDGWFCERCQPCSTQPCPDMETTRG